MIFKKLLFSACFSAMLIGYAEAQFRPILPNNAISTSVPFLLISPDARAAGMGDGGVASTPDAASGHWNPAKFAFIDKPGEVALSLTPWLRQLVSDVNFAYLAGYGKVGKNSTLSGSLKFFSLGNIAFTDEQGNSLGNFNPNEFELASSYSTKLSKHFSIGVGLKFIYSNLAGGIAVQGAEPRPGIAGGGDIGFFYNNKTKVEKKDLNYSIGLSILNIGNKITYTTSAERDFIPTNMKLGFSVMYDIDEYNSIGGLFDVSKLLVPTPPQYLLSSNGITDSIDNNGNRIIEAGKEPNVPVIQGMVQSFYDAPGGFSEELKELNISLGAEYWYRKQFAVRAGYYYEHPTKGNRQYLTFGVGFRMNVFGLDVAYLAPIAQRHPLQNTLRFTLSFGLDAFKSNQKETPGN